MTSAGFLTYALALGVAAAVPGPGVVALIARALSSGFKAAMAFAVGLVLGDLTFLSAAVFGLALIAETLGELFLVVRLCAGLYLAILGVRLWRSAGRTDRVEGGPTDRPLASFVAGLTVTLANPKTIVFYLAVLPTLIDLRTITTGDYATLIGLTGSVLAVVMTPYAALAARARDTLSEPAFRARLNRGAAAIMAGAAIWTIARRA
ncbi:MULTISPECIES: LysE family translocator [unclassified Methylobacterium]|uniref:LysE family translocator n=1 Tax=unclassified Methylobacterium TaxID=2615210 RepID=UPI0011C20196|nr:MULTISPECIES: LysE family translocator [unclassified Methylobacterium]QEE40000.1 LysE family translocator [Methylobacterium sp. WL1]TXN58641.1 LysE family translocator [Methylobacterium sp. WL2]